MDLLANISRSFWDDVLCRHHFLPSFQHYPSSVLPSALDVARSHEQTTSAIICRYLMVEIVVSIEYIPTGNTNAHFSISD